jgi:hypothetical protein
MCKKFFQKSIVYSQASNYYGAYNHNIQSTCQTFWNEVPRCSFKFIIFSESYTQYISQLSYPIIYLSCINDGRYGMLKKRWHLITCKGLKKDITYKKGSLIDIYHKISGEKSSPENLVARLPRFMLLCNGFPT